MIYAPVRGERPDGLCRCGDQATTEVQVGWVVLADGTQGGQYDEICEECFLADFGEKAE